MAGANFELPREYLEKITKSFFDKYKKLSLEKYFKDNENAGKGDFNLPILIKDIFNMYDFQDYNFSEISTNDEANNWYSYRLYSQGKQKINGRVSSMISNKK